MFEEIKKIISSLFDEDTSSVTRETSFVKDLKMNSFDYVTLLGEIEDVFGIEIPDRDVKKIKTVGDLEDYISEKKN
jgi:acyl carrier protein